MEPEQAYQGILQSKDLDFTVTIQKLDSEDFFIKIKNDCRIGFYEEKISMSYLKQSNSIFHAYETLDEFFSILKNKIQQKSVVMAEFFNHAEISYEETLGEKTKIFKFSIQKVKIIIDNNKNIELFEKNLEEFKKVEVKNVELNNKIDKINEEKEELNNRITKLEDENHQLIFKLGEFHILIDSLLRVKLNYLHLSEYIQLNEWMPFDFKDFSLKLIYKATEHGFEAVDFHNKVDGVINTLTVITIENGIRIGGFTPVALTGSNDWKSDDSLKTFIFSLTKKAKFTLQEDQRKYAVCDYNGAGPCFGSCDLFIRNKPHLDNHERYKNSTNIQKTFKNHTLNIVNGSQEAQEFMTGSVRFKTREIETYIVLPF